jgi:hypothetical protein
MASGDAWQSGWNLGSALASQSKARKNALSDEEFAANFNDLQQNIGMLQSRLSNFPEGSVDRQKAQYALQQAIENRNQMFAKKPGAFQRLGEQLHLRKAPPAQPQATTPTFYQPTVAEPNGQRIPAGPATTIQGPQTPAQLKAQATARMMAAAAPPAAAAPQTPWERYRANWKEVMGQGSEPTQEAREEFARTGKVTQPKTEKWTPYGAPYMKNGQAFQDQKSPEGEIRTISWTGAPPKPPKMSAYQEQEATFGRTIGKDPATWGWAEESAFLKQRYGALQPYAARRLAISEQMAHLAAVNVALRSSENNMRDFWSTQKALTPIDRILTTAQRADDYVTNHNAAGDVALTLAFVDAIKPGTGFRFTDTERRWMTTGSRGIVEGALTRINQGYTGETLSPDQRIHERNIIKEAAAQATRQRSQLLGTIGQINPRVANLTGGTPGTTQTPQRRTPQRPGTTTGAVPAGWQ